ncbi:hypothetical protein UG55_11151, partial [Frankia sp. EI5c]
MTTNLTVGMRFRRIAGFGFGGIPFIMALGLAYLMATLPELFRLLADAGVDRPWAEPVTAWLETTSADWQRALQEPAITDQVSLLLRGVLLAVPLLWAASLVRAARVGSARPFVAMVTAGVLAVLALPLIGWLCTAGAAVSRFARSVTELIRDVIAWFGPLWLVLGWIFVVLFGLAALAFVGFVIYSIVLFLHQNRLWAATAAVIALLAAIALVIRLGLLDGIFAWVAGVAQALASWLAAGLGWLATWSVIVTLALFVAGSVFAVLGQVGHMLFSQLGSATRAGREQAACIDLGAGMGVTLSLFLCAAIADVNSFRPVLHEAWRTTPLVNYLPDPTGTYELLVTDAAERVVSPAFTNYSATVSAVVFLLVAALGLLALLFQEGSWDTNGTARITRPVLLGVGLAVALAIPILIITVQVDPGRGAG